MKRILFIAHHEDNNPYAVEQKLTVTENGSTEIAIIVVNVPNKGFILPGLKQLERKLSEAHDVDNDALLHVRYLLGILRNLNNRMTVTKDLIKTVANELRFKWLKPEHVIYMPG